MTPEDYHGLMPLSYAHINPDGRFYLDLESWVDFERSIAQGTKKT
jgi:hypothetical protein